MDKTKKKSSVGLVIVAVVILLLIIVAANSLFVVQKNEYGVVWEFGAVTDVKETPGLYFKIPFINTVSKLPNTVLLYDLPISDVITADKHSMVLDSFALWKIDDPRLFIESLSGSVSNAESRINAIVYNALKTVISSQKQETIISGRDGRVVQLVMENIGSSFDRYGITVFAVETKTLDLPDDNKDAVYTRMISERNNIAAAYTAEGEAEAQKIHNETDKQVRIVKAQAEKDAAVLEAEGESAYMATLSKAYDTEEKAEFYSYIRGLDTLKQSLKGEKTIILDKNSELAKILYGNF